MKKGYIIQHAKTKEYWIGYYSIKWSDDISLAKIFYNREDIDEWINDEYSNNKIFIIIVEVYKPE